MNRRLQVHVQRRVAEGSKIDQRSLAVGRLQGQSQIDGDGGCAVSAFGIDDGKHLAARTFLLHPALGGGEADECFQKIGGSGGALDELASPGAHGA